MHKEAVISIKITIKKRPSLSHPNLLNQVFQAKKKNKIWLGDITYIPLKHSTLYLSVFIDVFTRKIVGWSMDTRMKDTIVIDAFLQALGKEHLEERLIIHTGQGSQYTGSRFQEALRKKRNCI